MDEMKLDLKKLVKRVGETGDFITYDEARCDGCGMCELVCSMGAWRVKDGKAKLAPRYAQLCLECAGCWEACPRDAIEFSYPRGGTGVIIEYG